MSTSRIEINLSDLIGCIKDITDVSNDISVTVIIDDNRQLQLLVKDKSQLTLVEYIVWAQSINERPSKRSTSRLYFKDTRKLE
jgi:hypothetical protein